MPGKKLDELPSDIKEQLEDGAQQIFLTALNSAQEDGMDEAAAMHLAWNTIEHDYEKGEDGKWHRRPQQENITHKSVQSGGN
ncbi:MAG: ChaB family protein [Aphanothece sp. CMT-3BRIN-NPC111]|jgi:cation transport regulator|nr:ChaB family protein [Aphanothece sp. CMT-3BRIN-NPC111]